MTFRSPAEEGGQGPARPAAPPRAERGSCGWKSWERRRERRGKGQCPAPPAGHAGPRRPQPSGVGRGPSPRQPRSLLGKGRRTRGRPEPSLGKGAQLGAVAIPPWEEEAAEPAIVAISPWEAGAEPGPAAIPLQGRGSRARVRRGPFGKGRLSAGLGVRRSSQLKNSGPVSSLRFLISCCF